MRPHVRLRTPGGGSKVLGPGDIIGRMPGIALSLNDPRLSEAHVMVSLRGSQLKLLGLRGRFSVYGKPRSEVVLKQGLRIVLAGRIALVVEDVVLPPSVLGLEGPGVPQQVLEGVTSVTDKPRVTLTRGIVADAQLVFWSSGDAFYCQDLRTEDRQVALVQADSTWVVAGELLRVVAIPLADAARGATERQGDTDDPLTLVVNYDTVHIHMAGSNSLVIDGIGARILSELMLVGVPISWEAVAREVWSDVGDGEALRKKWDASLTRLRGKLREAGVRPDLVRADGTGNVELLLGLNDRILDRT